LLVAILLLLATIRSPGPRPAPPGPGEAVLRIAPVTLDASDPRRNVAGRLRFLGGWSLASDDSRFGGISAIHVEDGEATALSDSGLLIRFALPGASRTAPVRFDPLVEGPGPRTRKSNRDTEGLLVRGDQIWVSFEHHNMIWRYRRGTWRALSAARPPAMSRWPGNAGPEGLVRLADGRFLVFTEGRDDGRPDSEAVLFAGDPSLPGMRTETLRYRRIAGFRVSDAATLPDGRILILSRRFGLLTGWSARLVLADAPGLRTGSVIDGREIAALEAPFNVDNMEALSVTVENGRNIVWIASDDNFSPLQRTLLLKFELMS
jgi:hypothetical protein